MRLAFFISILLITCCSYTIAHRPAQAPHFTGSAAEASPDAQILEVFTDSTHIGVKGQCKIEIVKYTIYEDAYLLVKFYTRTGNSQWYLQDTYMYETTSLQALEPDISDYNNDGFNDITVISATAARGANEVRRLFIYDRKYNRLISIVNAEDFPNMQYNPELDCIDAFLVYGASTTVFAHIAGDSLKIFAQVANTADSVFVYVTGKKGKDKLIYKGPGAGPYIRHSNFRRLKINGEQ